jgi:hypothetical protein
MIHTTWKFHEAEHLIRSLLVDLVILHLLMRSVLMCRKLFSFASRPHLTVCRRALRTFALASERFINLDIGFARPKVEQLDTATPKNSF